MRHFAQVYIGRRRYSSSSSRPTKTMHSGSPVASRNLSWERQIYHGRRWVRTFNWGQTTFFKTLKELKTPSRYVSNLHRRIEKGKLRGLKSHDFHVIFQQILPVCVRNIQNQELACAIIRLSRVFQRVCEKVISKDMKNQLLGDVAETMVLLEKQLPPAAFTIMMHLPYHIV